MLQSRLSSFITSIREAVFGIRILRYAWYLMIILALVLFWLYFGDVEIAFVYTDF